MTQNNTDQSAHNTVLPLEQIFDRPQNTRELKSNHVQGLAESIAVLGLIEPLVIDNQGRLLAGAHRKAAITWLRDNNSLQFDRHFPSGLIPVRMMPFNSIDEPEKALEIEISENEKRRDYTPNEVKSLAERLRQAGYVDSPGRPKEGEKRLRPALEIIVGKSLRSVRRYLTEDKPVQNGQVSEKVLLKRAYQSLQKWNVMVKNSTKATQELQEKLESLLPLIEEVLESTTQE
jgi:ParB family chromosome partitioning protein